MRPLAPRAWAALLVAGCAGAGPVHPEGESLRDEIRALRHENEALSARVEALSTRVDLLTIRATQAGTRRTAEPAGGVSAAADAAGEGRQGPGAVIPPDLEVVRVAPEPLRFADAPVRLGDPVRPAPRAPARVASRPARSPSPVPTTVQIQEPDLSTLDSLARPGRRPLAAEAEQELRDARAQSGLGQAHALEDFTSRYPQHPAADNALVEASAAYQAAGREEAACTLVRRVVDEYPAGDALSEALERLAACEARRGSPENEQRLLARLRADFPGTPAAQRAEARLSQGSGRSGETAPRDVPARSSP